MSSNIFTVTPSIDFEHLQHRDVRIKSPSATMIKQWVSSSYSNNSISWSMPPSSLSTFIDRCFMVQIPFCIQMNGAAPAGGLNLLQIGRCALRAFPIDSILNSIQLTLGDQTFVIMSSDITPYLAHYFKFEEYVTFPSFLDNYSQYSDAFGSNNNPLSGYQDGANASGYGESFTPLRGDYGLVMTSTSTAGQVTGIILQPIFMPCLSKHFDASLGFCNLKSIDLVLNLSSNLGRIWSQDSFNTPLTTITVNMCSSIVAGIVVPSPPSLFNKYTTCPDYVPRDLTYSNQDIQRFSTSMGSILSGGSIPLFPSTNIQLGCVPSNILVFARSSNSSLTYASTDTFLNISNVSITWNNNSGILSSATELQLFQMSKKNGLDSSWTQWQGQTLSGNAIGATSTLVGTVGSCMMLSFGDQILLNTSDGDYVGKIGSYNLTVQATFNNRFSYTVNNPMMYVIVITPSKIIIHADGHVDSVLGTSGEQGEYMSYHELMKHYGGRSSFSDIVKKVVGYLKPIHDFVKEHKLISSVASMIPHPIAQTVAQTARTLGYGDGEGDGEGGRAISRAKLLRKIRHLER